MAKLEFEGNLIRFSPSKIINKEHSTDFDSFFLILAMVFNDLKSLVFFQKVIEDNYRKPEADEISIQMGEYAGLLSYVNKLILSTLSEFLIFLEKNKGITSSPKFLLLIKQLDGFNRKNWTKIINHNKDEATLISKIARIRSNIAFHYDQSKEELKKGFIRSFYKEAKSMKQHTKAYVSLGDDMRSTRFYYADAAVGEYIRSLLTQSENATLTEYVSSMNLTLQLLLKNYFERKL